jgi:hypothetical protein
MVCKCWFQRDIRENAGSWVILMEELPIFTLRHLRKYDAPSDKIKELTPQIQFRPESNYAETPTEKSEVIVVYVTCIFSPNTTPQYKKLAAYLHGSHKQFTQSPFSSVPIYSFVVTIEIIN